MHTSPPWQDRELCVLYIQGVFSTMTYSPAAHTNKACLGLRKKKKVFLFLAYILEVEGLNWYGLKERSSPRSLVYCRHSPVDVSLPAVTNGSKCHLLLWWFVRKKSDLVWQQWDKCQERHPRRWREDTLRRENKKKTTTQKQETIKIPFRHECDSSEQGCWGPWWWAQGSPSVKKTQMAVMSVQNGSVGLCHAIHKSLSAVDPGQEEERFSCWLV